MMPLLSIQKTKAISILRPKNKVSALLIQSCISHDISHDHDDHEGEGDEPQRQMMPGLVTCRDSETELVA
jgi:hypothetical protein